MLTLLCAPANRSRYGVAVWDAVVFEPGNITAIGCADRPSFGGGRAGWNRYLAAGLTAEPSLRPTPLRSRYSTPSGGSVVAVKTILTAGPATRLGLTVEAPYNNAGG